MHNFTKITDGLFYIGGSDRRLALFENVFPIPRGVSYNSYVIVDEKTALLDTVDVSVSGIFFENLAAVLNGRKLDYLIVNHMEPDHAATLHDVVLRYPEVKIVTNLKAANMMRQFFTFDVDERLVTVVEGGTLPLGEHTLAFVMAPMVHWPEAMLTYEVKTKTLFSADAFGTFGALSGNIFADELDFENEWLADARRYYTNIVGKYGTQVSAVLKKAAGIEIDYICPLHGPIWRSNIPWFIGKYAKWAAYESEEKAVLIAYGSVYGNTENAANILAAQLAKRGVKRIAMYDVSATHPSYLVAEAFRCSHLVFASTTYNAGIFCNMETLLTDLKAHNLQNRAVAIIENGSWAPTSGGLMTQLFASMKNMRLLAEPITLRSSVKEFHPFELAALADSIVADMGLAPASCMLDAAPCALNEVDKSALFKLSYGLYVLTAKDGEKLNGCIINTAAQVTDTPVRISVTVNKANYTHDIIKKTGKFCVSPLDVTAPFELFKRFGFQAGREVDKFLGLGGVSYSASGLPYLTEHSNAMICADVEAMHDFGTHTLFVGLVVESKTLCNEESCTYSYYFGHIKPKPQAAPAAKSGFVCKICGYVHEGDELPSDIVCPLCKHGAEDFERIG